MSSSPPTASPVLMGPISLEEFLSWGETDVQYELVDGWVVVNPMPNLQHQRVAMNLLRVLDRVRPEGHEVFAVPLDWVLFEGRPNVRQPDVTIVEIQQGARLTRPPLLAVEILSPGGNERDLVTKRLEYAVAGLRHYWVVDPEVPAVVVFAGAELEEVARAAGDEALHLQEPFAVTVVPRDLVSPPVDR